MFQFQKNYRDLTSCLQTMGSWRTSRQWDAVKIHQSGCLDAILAHPGPSGLIDTRVPA